MLNKSLEIFSSIVAGSGKVIRNLYLGPDHHQKLISTELITTIINITSVTLKSNKTYSNHFLYRISKKTIIIYSKSQNQDKIDE